METEVGNSIQYNLELSAEANGLFHALARQSGLSLQDVFRFAISLYKLALDARDNGQFVGATSRQDGLDVIFGLSTSRSEGEGPALADRLESLEARLEGLEARLCSESPRSFDVAVASLRGVESRFNHSLADLRDDLRNAQDGIRILEGQVLDLLHRTKGWIGAMGEYPPEAARD